MKTKLKLFKRIIACTMLIAVALTACSCGSKADFGGAMMDGLYPSLSDQVSGEGYTEITENAFISTADQSTSYFSIDANTASYPNLRSIINNGYRIYKDAVRVEEMLNYFDYDYATPTDGSILSLNSSVFDNPYNAQTKIMTIGLAAQEVEFTKTSNNLVFLIDSSGSMSAEDKLPLVQSSFKLLTENLNPEDRVSVVTYAGGDKVLLKGAYGYEKQKINAVIEDLFASGSTAGSKGIETAYEIASQYFIEGGNNRVILATDGDFNVGISNTSQLERFISKKRNSGIYFSVFGVGRGNLQAEKMETLALNGNGTYSYIDTLTEARRALVEQIGGSMITVAKDVKAGVEFNPEYVESFRLIGYENKLLTQEEFEDESTDAGELGSGHTVTVAYEITPTEAFVGSGDIATVKIKYKPADVVGGGQEQELNLAVKADYYHAEMTANDAFVASVIEFALVLRDSQYKADASINGIISRLEGLGLTDEYKLEFLELVKKYSQMPAAE